MGESDRYSDYRQQRKRRFALGEDGNAVMGLFTINVIFFLVLLVIQVTYFFFQKGQAEFDAQVLQYFELPAQLTKLSERPWAVLTYMFSHVSVMQVLSNMLWLWAFGSIMQDMAGNSKIVPVYIYGGVAGAVFFILANYSILPLKPFVGQSFLLGGNAATMAVAVATATLAPGYRFFRSLNGGISIWVLMFIYILVDLAGIANMGAAYSISHLGGALAGFLFVVFLRRGKDGSLWMQHLYSWFFNLFSPVKKTGLPSIKEKVFYNTEGRLPYKRAANVTQQRVDEILDKINQQGYHFLTDEEKSILKRASEEELD